MAFDRKSPDEVRLLSFDFSAKAPSTVTLTNPTVTVAAVVAGTGAVGDVTLGTGIVDGLVVTTLGTGGLDGNRYRIKAEVDGSNGEHYEMDKDLPVAANSAVAP